MIPDLGKYSGPVLSAYLVSLVLLAAIVVISWRRAIRVKRDLTALEEKGKPNG